MAPAFKKAWPGLLALAAVIVVGCGGDEGSDASDLITAFEREADLAYEEAGVDDPETALGPTQVEGCFIADQEALAAIAASVDVETLEVAEDTILTGPPQERLLQCFALPDGSEVQQIAGISAGTTVLTTDEFRDRGIRNRGEIEDLEGSAPGLDPDDVVAFRADDISFFSWVTDGFAINLTSPEPDPEVGFTALAALVDEVARVLGVDPPQ